MSKGNPIVGLTHVVVSQQEMLEKAYEQIEELKKVSKRNPNQMLSDRREITEGEILMLIDWLLDQKWDDVEKDGGALCFESRAREGMVVEMKLVDKDKIERL